MLGVDTAVELVGVSSEVGWPVTVTSMATRLMGMGGVFLRAEGLGTKPTSAGLRDVPSMWVSRETEWAEWTMPAMGRSVLQILKRLSRMELWRDVLGAPTQDNRWSPSRSKGAFWQRGHCLR